MDISWIQNLLLRYNQLESRERLAVNGLIGFVALLLIYTLIWSPANTYYDKGLQNHVRQLSTLQYLRASEQQARASLGKQSRAAVSGQSLLSTVSSSAQQSGIKPSRLQPEGNNGVSVTFSEVSFNDLIEWLESLQSQGFVVGRISIDRQEQSGKVNARITLRS
ncbi:MAG: type II secretion system protein M [bacterium]